MVNQRVSLYLGIAWFLTVTVLLSLPGKAFPQENWMSKFQLDKLVHFFLFAPMVLLWVTALGKNYPTKKPYMMLCVVVGFAAALHGTIMEFVQLYFVPNRDFEWNDILADAGGSLVGALFSMGRYLKK